MKLRELLNLDFKSRAKRPRVYINSAFWCAKALKFLAQNGIKMIEKLIQKSKNITAAGRSDIEPAWIAQAQRRLGFALPVSYKQMLLRYASVSAAGTELKTIAPPEFAEDADADICYTYEINLKNGLFAADELVFLQLEDEEYYFKISPASDIADGLPNTARGKTAESRSDKAAGATMSEAADETAGGAMNEIASERAGDAPCEYKVYVRDYAQSEDRLFADDFYGFLEKF